MLILQQFWDGLQLSVHDNITILVLYSDSPRDILGFLLSIHVHSLDSPIWILPSLKLWCVEFPLAIIELYSFTSISALKWEKNPKDKWCKISLITIISDVSLNEGKLFKTVFVEKSVKYLSWFILKHVSAKLIWLLYTWEPPLHFICIKSHHC